MGPGVCDATTPIMEERGACVSACVGVVSTGAANRVCDDADPECSEVSDDREEEEALVVVVVVV